MNTTTTTYPFQTEVSEAMALTRRIGPDAEVIERALDALDEVQSGALIAFYNSRIAFDRQARLFRVTEDVLQARLRAAHVDLYLQLAFERRRNRTAATTSLA